jgi:hypothetical protein
MMSENVLKGGHGAIPINAQMVRNFHKWQDEGVPRREMSRRTGVSLRRIMLVLGKLPSRQTGNPRPVWNVYTHRRPWKEATKIAKALGYRISAGNNTGQGSIGAMVEAIGNGELMVVPKESWAEIQGNMEQLRRYRADERRAADGS